MSTTLTPEQQGDVRRASVFHRLGGRIPDKDDSYSLGVAIVHIRRLLEVIDDLTDGDAS